MSSFEEVCMRHCDDLLGAARVVCGHKAPKSQLPAELALLVGSFE